MQKLLVCITLLVACCLGLTSAAQCSTGFVEINGVCLAFAEAQYLNWHDSQKYCSEIGGRLAEIDNPDTHRSMYEYIITYSLSGDFWLGGSDLAVEDDWVYTDSSRVARGTPFWALNHGLFGYSIEPEKSETENCQAMVANLFWYWDDRDCDLLYHPLCVEL